MTTCTTPTDRRLTGPHPAVRDVLGGELAWVADPDPGAAALRLLLDRTRTPEPTR